MESEAHSCEFCQDTGYVQNVEFDEDSHTYQDAGLIICKHPNNYEDYTGATVGNREID